MRALQAGSAPFRLAWKSIAKLVRPMRAVDTAITALSWKRSPAFQSRSAWTSWTSSPWSRSAW
jgi:hypothetical protein